MGFSSFPTGRRTFQNPPIGRAFVLTPFPKIAKQHIDNIIICNYLKNEADIFGPPPRPSTMLRRGADWGSKFRDKFPTELKAQTQDGIPTRRNNSISPLPPICRRVLPDFAYQDGLFHQVSCLYLPPADLLR